MFILFTHILVVFIKHFTYEKIIEKRTQFSECKKVHFNHLNTDDDIDRDEQK